MNVPMEATMGTIPVMIVSAGLLVVGFVLGWLLSSKVSHSKIQRAELSAEKILDDALTEAEAMKRTAVLEANDQMHQERLQFEKELEDKRDETSRAEIQLSSLTRQLDKRADLLNHKEKLATTKEDELSKLETRLTTRSEEL